LIHPHPPFNEVIAILFSNGSVKSFYIRVSKGMNESDIEPIFPHCRKKVQFPYQLPRNSFRMGRGKRARIPQIPSRPGRPDGSEEGRSQEEDAGPLNDQRALFQQLSDVRFRLKDIGYQERAHRYVMGRAD
jgi:hypothetical protein